MPKNELFLLKNRTPPPDPLASPPQTPIGLRRLGAPSPDPRNIPLPDKFLATRLLIGNLKSKI